MNARAVACLPNRAVAKIITWSVDLQSVGVVSIGVCIEWTNKKASVSFRMLAAYIYLSSLKRSQLIQVN
jgi:hypothetical protein